MGIFVVSKRFNGGYQFNLKATNGQIILASETYSSKSSCLKGIEAVKESSKIDECFEKKITNNNKYYFVLKAFNGAIVGSSELYESSIAIDNAIESVKRNASNASIEDLTL
ncbi:YegP family protein [Elizabethkingia anophelis]